MISVPSSQPVSETEARTILSSDVDYFGGYSGKMTIIDGRVGRAMKYTHFEDSHTRKSVGPKEMAFGRELQVEA